MKKVIVKGFVFSESKKVWVEYSDTYVMDSVESLIDLLERDYFRVYFITDLETGHCYYSKEKFIAEFSDGCILASTYWNWAVFFKNVKLTCNCMECSANIYCIKNGEKVLVRKCGKR